MKIYSEFRLTYNYLSLYIMEKTEIIEDLVKAIVIILIVNSLLVMVDDIGELLDGNTLRALLYVSVGITIYHLIVKKFLFKKTKKLSTRV